MNTIQLIKILFENNDDAIANIISSALTPPNGISILLKVVKSLPQRDKLLFTSQLISNTEPDLLHEVSRIVTNNDFDSSFPTYIHSDIDCKYALLSDRRCASCEVGLCPVCFDNMNECPLDLHVRELNMKYGISNDDSDKFICIKCKKKSIITDAIVDDYFCDECKEQFGCDCCSDIQCGFDHGSIIPCVICFHATNTECASNILDDIYICECCNDLLGRIGITIK